MVTDSPPICNARRVAWVFLPRIRIDLVSAQLMPQKRYLVVFRAAGVDKAGHDLGASAAALARACWETWPVSLGAALAFRIRYISTARSPASSGRVRSIILSNFFPYLRDLRSWVANPIPDRPQSSPWNPESSFPRCTGVRAGGVKSAQ